LLFLSASQTIFRSLATDTKSVLKGISRPADPETSRHPARS